MIKPVKPSEEKTYPAVFLESVEVIRKEVDELAMEDITRAIDDAYRIGYVDGAKDMLFMKEI